MARATDPLKAERLNRARTLLREHARLPQAAERLARDWSISKRQAYRYLQQAQNSNNPFRWKMPKSLLRSSFRGV